MKRGKWTRNKLLQTLKSVPNFSVSIYADRHRNLRRVVRKANKNGLVEVTRVGGLFYVKGR